LRAEIGASKKVVLLNVRILPAIASHTNAIINKFSVALKAKSGHQVPQIERKFFLTKIKCKV
jgi:hypothetical protein